MVGKESGSADTKDFIKGMLSYHDSNCSGGGIPSLTIKDGIRLSKALTGQQLSAKK